MRQQPSGTIPGGMMTNSTNGPSDDRRRWTADGLYYEYSKAANPIAAGTISRVPLPDSPPPPHEEGPTRITPFALSGELKCPAPATSPALCANFIRILPAEEIGTRPN